MPRSVVALPAFQIAAHAREQLLDDALVLANGRHHSVQKVGIDLGRHQREHFNSHGNRSSMSDLNSLYYLHITASETNINKHNLDNDLTESQTVT